MPEENLYARKASLVFVGLAFFAILLTSVFLLSGCADSCHHRTGDGICVDKSATHAG